MPGAARHLALQYFRMYGPPPDAPALRGSLYGSGFARQFAARAQALSPMLFFARLLPTVSLDNRVAGTEVLPSPRAGRQERMIRGSAAHPSYEVSESFAPWEHNAVIDDVAGTLALTVIANVKRGKALELRLRIVCTAPGVGESHFASPSDCFEWSCRDDAFGVRDKVDIGERERGCAELAAEWKRSDVEWGASDKSKVVRWAPGRPVRTSVGGLGGSCLLGMAPEPVLWPSWEGMVANRRNVRGLLFELVGTHDEAMDRLGQRTKTSSPSGGMRNYFSKSGKKMALPPLISMSQPRSKFGPVAPKEEDNGT